MKELSIKEKAKRYEEAIERAKAYKGLRSEMEIIFPELKESDDEKIRKRLIERLKCMEVGSPTEIGEEVAWLEKQGKQKQ